MRFNALRLFAEGDADDDVENHRDGETDGAIGNDALRFVPAGVSASRQSKADGATDHGRNRGEGDEAEDEIKDEF